MGRVMTSYPASRSEDSCRRWCELVYVWLDLCALTTLLDESVRSLMASNPTQPHQHVKQ
jgi:hypothetical protein